MPIVVEVMEQEKYTQWVAEMQRVHLPGLLIQLLLSRAQVRTDLFRLLVEI